MSPRRQKHRVSDPFGTLESLETVASDCWFSWNEVAQRPFAALSPVLWESTKHSPSGVLAAIDPAVLEAKLADERFRALVSAAADARRAYHETASWHEEQHASDTPGMRIAYFSSEFAIHESMQQYAGGLGVLAGDHLKSASDLGIPLVGVGLLYRQGYYLQELRGDGTTRVRWKRRMALERQYDDVFKITMDNGVEVLHAGARADDTLSMRCDVLEATVKRPLDAGAKGEGSEKGSEKGADERGVDLGGPAELLGVKGTGGVFIRTPEQDVECGSFDYSVTTGIATLTAEEGRTVTIAVKGQPAPIRAQQVIWDLRNGRIQVLKASGTAGR